MLRYIMRDFSGGVAFKAVGVMTICCGGSGSVSEIHDLIPGVHACILLIIHLFSLCILHYFKISMKGKC